MTDVHHHGEPLTVQQIEALQEGQEVVVTWSGGNGPHPYRVILVNGRPCVDNIYQDRLLRWDGQLRPVHHVTLATTDKEAHGG
jgi:hypothetical protein